ncbi:unnamed protein product [Ilex paraguariensis]|uniref:Secreted protein n=1 Tax=Ilex paraguariensis TaxID=185542 RepID=A0ABC8TUR5_9AQUA
MSITNFCILLPRVSLTQSSPITCSVWVFSQASQGQVYRAINEGFIMKTMDGQQEYAKFAHIRRRRSTDF